MAAQHSTRDEQQQCRQRLTEQLLQLCYLQVCIADQQLQCEAHKRCEALQQCQDT
jgi:hypothetical protein